MEPYFIMEDLHNFGLHYDYTLMEWLKRFKASWPELKNNYSEKFYRMWIYYLSSCAASFRMRKNNLWQIVMIKKTYPGEYKPIRKLHFKSMESTVPENLYNESYLRNP